MRRLPRGRLVAVQPVPRGHQAPGGTTVPAVWGGGGVRAQRLWLPPPAEGPLQAALGGRIRRPGRGRATEILVPRVEAAGGAPGAVDGGTPGGGGPVRPLGCRGAAPQLSAAAAWVQPVGAARGRAAQAPCAWSATRRARAHTGHAAPGGPRPPLAPRQRP